MRKQDRHRKAYYRTISVTRVT